MVCSPARRLAVELWVNNQWQLEGLSQNIRQHFSRVTVPRVSPFELDIFVVITFNKMQNNTPNITNLIKKEYSLKLMKEEFVAACKRAGTVLPFFVRYV